MGRIGKRRPDEVVAFEFTTEAGKVLRRGFTITEAPEEPSIPTWLYDQGKKWPTPQEPVTYTGKVRAGHEAEARQWLRDLAPLGGADNGTRRK